MSKQPTVSIAKPPTQCNRVGGLRAGKGTRTPDINLGKVAHRLNRMGFNVTAIREGAKSPAHKWECWQDTRQTVDDVNGFPWLGAGGIGAIMGIGGLHVFDFDKCPDYGPVATVLQSLGLPDSYSWLWRSGSGNGYGVAVLCFDDLPSGVSEHERQGAGGVFGSWQRL